jgi:sigma-B regulation protein RsbU (phosphoserine phosphatase)
MSETSHKSRYEIKELELNSLLEITQAINNNVPEDFLYKIYNFTLRSNLKIKKLALYVLDDLWNCKVNFGTEQAFQ